jgi:hypothetical protein
VRGLDCGSSLMPGNPGDFVGSPLNLQTHKETYILLQKQQKGKNSLFSGIILSHGTTFKPKICKLRRKMLHLPINIFSVLKL